MMYFKVILVLFLTGYIFSFSKKTIDNNSLIETETNRSLKSEGEKLAKKYCSSCHAYTQPTLLDKKTWLTGVLPNMGRRLGIKTDSLSAYAGYTLEEFNASKDFNIYPENSLISISDWNKIIEFYESEAPEKLPENAEIKSDSLSLFSAKYIKFQNNKFPQITLVEFDSFKQKLYIGDATGKVSTLTKELSIANNWFLSSAPSDIIFSKNAPPEALTIGVFSPSNQKKGKLEYLITDPNYPLPEFRLNQLRRPVFLPTLT